MGTNKTSISLTYNASSELSPLDMAREIKRKNIRFEKSKELASRGVENIYVNDANVDTPKEHIIIENEKAIGGNSTQSSLVDWAGWLPFASKQYNISPDVKDYVVIPVPTIITDIPNRNGIAFPLKEMITFRPDLGMQSYRTWKGKPTFEEHCFPASSKVLTVNGYKPIATLKKGDLVYTHTGELHPVKKLFKNGIKNLSRVRTESHGGDVYGTSNHPFYVVDKRQVYSGKSEYTGGRSNTFGGFDTLKPHFRPLEDIYAGDYLVTKLLYKGSVTINPDWAFLVGLYLAEGCPSKTGYKGKVDGFRLTLGSVEKKLHKKVRSILESLNIKYSEEWRDSDNTLTFHGRDKEYAHKLVCITGEYSHAKSLSRSEELYTWSSESLKHLLGGYISGDGCTHGRLRIVTASRDISLDIQNILGSLGIPSTINRSDKGKVRADGSDCIHYTIGVAGRYAKALNPYIVGKRKLKSEKSDRATRVFIHRDMLLTPVLSVTATDIQEEVYNIEVGVDHSYIVDGFVVHNCHEDVTKAKGVILDTHMRKIPGMNVWRLMKLLAFDRTRDPQLCDDILARKRNSYSMGAYLDGYTCSVCHKAFGMCSHLPTGTKKGDVVFLPQGDSIVFLNVVNPEGFETSSVKTPAFIPALNDNVIDMSQLIGEETDQSQVVQMANADSIWKFKSK